MSDEINEDEARRILGECAEGILRGASWLREKRDPQSELKAKVYDMLGLAQEAALLAGGPTDASVAGLPMAELPTNIQIQVGLLQRLALEFKNPVDPFTAGHILGFLGGLTEDQRSIVIEDGGRRVTFHGPPGTAPFVFKGTDIFECLSLLIDGPPKEDGE